MSPNNTTSMFPFTVGSPCPFLKPDLEGLYLEAVAFPELGVILHVCYEAYRGITQQQVIDFEGNWQFAIHVSPEMPMALPLARYGSRICPLPFDITNTEARKGKNYYDPFLQVPYTQFLATLSDFHRDPSRRIVRASRFVEPPSNFCIALANILRYQRGLVRDDAAETLYIAQHDPQALWDSAIVF